MLTRLVPHWPQLPHPTCRPRIVTLCDMKVSLSPRYFHSAKEQGPFDQKHILEATSRCPGTAYLAFLLLYPPYTSIDKVPIMANYQSTHNFTPRHPSEDNPEAQSTGAPHPAQHVQGAMDNLMAKTLPAQTLADNKADEAIG